MNEELLDRPAQQTALRLAGEAIHAAVNGQPGPTPDEIATAQRESPALREPAGAFVTLYVSGQLRGCLGEIEPEEPLAEVIVRCASRVARFDYRFAPLESHELPEMTFKLSVLTPPIPVCSTDEIRVGTHGLIARHEGQGGLLLPEVPVEHGWNVPEFLRNLWRKAGIAPNVPTRDVKLWTFTSQVIASESYALK